MIVSANRPLRQVRRSAFTLLEVLVVVAIIVILAGIAGVAMFSYIEDARVDAARTQMTVFENACKNYMAKSEGNVPPNQLSDLVAPTDGSRPLVDGGPAILTPPTGGQYNYDRDHVDSYGSPDPMVSLTTKDGKTFYSTRRKGPQ